MGRGNFLSAARIEQAACQGTHAAVPGANTHKFRLDPGRLDNVGLQAQQANGMKAR